MPNSFRHGSPRKKTGSSNSSGSNDFTLADFADANEAKSGRMKKGDTSCLPIEVRKKSSLASAAVESLAWDEKDLTEFDIDPASLVSRKQEFADEDVILIGPRDVTPSSNLCSVSRRFGTVYPVDIWILISEFIDPEDVARFAGISQGSHMVVHTAQFWMRLYKRCYSDKVQLPDSLKPCYMEKVHGLRTRVIQSLFYLYSPLSGRLQRKMAFENEPASLSGLRCVLMWHKRYKNQCHFFFKFQRSASVPCCMAPNIVGMGRLARFTSDIVHNSEEDCVVLQVNAQQYLSLPPTVMGMLLHTSFLSVGRGMRYHKLRLVFTSAPIHSTTAALGSGTTLTMDPVINAKILHWWEPSYPQPT